MKERTGVILFNLGGPETLDDVEPFLVNLFSDPDIMDLPPLIGRFLPKLIARRRAPKSRGYYQAIGGGSPLRSITERQSRLLEESLNQGSDQSSLFKVAVAMRYAAPTLAEAMEILSRFDPQKLVLLPLYPQRSTTTTRSSFREFLELLPGRFNLPDRSIHVVPAYPAFPLYTEAVAETIQEALDRVPNDNPIDILFSAHGIPESRVKKGDPYQKDTESTAKELSSLLTGRNPGKKLRFHLSYQSRVGPLKWLGPETKKMIGTLSTLHHCVNLILVPVSFVSDHQETLYEMDITYKELSNSLRILHFERARALNTQPTFIRALKELTLQSLSGKTPLSSPCNCNCGICPDQ